MVTFPIVFNLTEQKHHLCFIKAMSTLVNVFLWMCSLQLSDNSGNPDSSGPGTCCDRAGQRCSLDMWTLLFACQILLFSSCGPEVLLQEARVSRSLCGCVWFQPEHRLHLLQQPCVFRPWVSRYPILLNYSQENCLQLHLSTQNKSLLKCCPIWADFGLDLVG